jgi:hypothetical protein
LTSLRDLYMSPVSNSTIRLQFFGLPASLLATGPCSSPPSHRFVVGCGTTMFPRPLGTLWPFYRTPAICSLANLLYLRKLSPPASRFLPYSLYRRAAFSLLSKKLDANVPGLFSPPFSYLSLVLVLSLAVA